MADPVFKERHHVSIAYVGEPVKFELGDKAFELRPGLNRVAIALWHAFGGSAEGQALIGTGAATAVCVDHDFPTKADGITPHPEYPTCRFCGCDRKTAKAEAKRRAHEATPEGKAELAKAAAERKAALVHHEECVKLAVAGDHEGAQKLAADHPGNQPDPVAEPDPLPSAWEPSLRLSSDPEPVK